MLEFRFPPPHLRDEEHFDAIRRVMAEVLDLQRTGGNRAANQAIVDRIGLDCSFVHDEAYHGDALNYHLGLLAAHVGEPQLTAEYIERSGTLPATGANRIFSDHQHESLDLYRRQQLARQRGMPSIVIASMRRAASASLTQTLAALLDAPIMRVSLGRSFLLVPRWLNAFTPGGAVLHDHFGAIPFNLATLHACGVRQVFVRARDPRPAAFSAARMVERRFGSFDPARLEDHVVDLYGEFFIPWLSGWLAAASDPAGQLRVHWLLQEPVQPGVTETVRQLLESHVADYPALAPYVAAPIAEVSANFVTGNDEAWRAQIGSRGQDRLWEATPEPVRALFQLRR